MKKLIGTVILVIVAGACASGTHPATQPAPGSTGTTSVPPVVATSPSGSPASTTTGVTVYYLVSGRNALYLAPERHRVGSTPAIAKAALEEMVHGKPQDPQHSTPFPKASRINSVVVRNSVATVDWSADVLKANVGAEAESRGIQSAVYTLAEFSRIKKVRFTVEGKDHGTASNGRQIEDWWGHVGLSGQPWDRDPAIEVLEPITLWTPLTGARSSGTLHLNGEASTFEANVGIVLRNAAGRVLVRTSTTAREGAPGRGVFSATINFRNPASPQTYILQVIEDSAKDGSVTFLEDRQIDVG